MADRISADEVKPAPRLTAAFGVSNVLPPYVSTAKLSALVQSQKSIYELLDGPEPTPSMLLRQFFGLNALIQPNLVGPKCAEWRSAALQDAVGATSIVNSPIILNIDPLFRIAHCSVRGRQASGGRPPNTQIAVETLEVIRMLQRIEDEELRSFRRPDKSSHLVLHRVASKRNAAASARINDFEDFVLSDGSTGICFVWVQILHSILSILRSSATQRGARQEYSRRLLSVPAELGARLRVPITDCLDSLHWAHSLGGSQTRRSVS